MNCLSIKERVQKGLEPIMPTRFMRIHFQINEISVPIIIEGSGNFQPHIDSSGKYFQDAKGTTYDKNYSRLKIDFESVYDQNIIFPSAQLKIYNLPFLGSPLEILDFKSVIKVEAGYNGFNLETIFEGYLLAKPFIVNEENQKYTCFQLTTKKESFGKSKIFNIGLNKSGDTKIKHLLNKILEAKSDWGEFTVNIPQTPEINALLEKEINFSGEFTLEAVLTLIGNLIGLQFVFYNEVFHSFYTQNCTKALTGEVNITEISKQSIIFFEDASSVKEKNLENRLEIEKQETAEFFEKAEEAEILNTGQFNCLFQAKSTANINAILSILIFTGKPDLGQIVTFEISGIERRFVVKSISAICNTHGVKDDFKTILELV